MGVASESATSLAESTTLSADNMNRMSVDSDTLSKTWGALTSKTQTIKAQIEWVNLNNLATMLMPYLFQQTVNAGGTSPGTSQAASTSGRSITQRGDARR